MSVRRRVSEADGAAAFAQVRQVFDTVLSGEKPLISAKNRADIEKSFTRVPRGVRATAVRYALEELATLAPGNSVEVRVPPYGVTQCIAGPRHTRGTPPSVVETSGFIWCALAAGALTWDDASASGLLTASGERSNLSRYFPLF